MQTIDLSNKNILVTGASRGIGKAIAEVLGGAGARIAVHCNKNKSVAQALAAKLDNGSKAFQADLSDTQKTNNLIHSVLEEFTHLDLLINNAGIAISSEVDKNSDEWIKDWQKTITVNLNASALLCKNAIDHFIGRQSGIIINISSRAAFRGDTQDYMAYAASKGGMVSLTKSIARAFGKQGITAFDVAPGFTRTDMAQDFIDQYGEDYALNDIALKQLTQPVDVARVVLFLASGMAEHATGTTIDVNAASYVH